MHVQYMYMHVVTCVHVLQLFTCSVKNTKLSKSCRKLAWQGILPNLAAVLPYDSTSTRACVLDMIRLSYTLLRAHLYGCILQLPFASFHM